MKKGMKRHKIKETPLLGQLYFVFYLILNRKEFKFRYKDRLLHNIGLFFCCTKRCISKWCSRRFDKAERRYYFFNKGREKLTKDLDIVKMIKREQMHDVHKQVLYNSTERFLLQY